MTVTLALSQNFVNRAIDDVHLVITQVLHLCNNIVTSLPNFWGAGARQHATEKREERKPGKRGKSLA